ncbi:MAG: hypothetical protein JNL66_00485 [Alphaproteobacteria bacterium]|nr:hypothetical protein [Alphaproteobacteria bacterium]
MRTIFAAAGVALSLLATTPVLAQPQSLTGTWTVAGENRYEDCTVWTPSGQLVVGAANAQGVYTGRIEITGRLSVAKDCANPPAEPPSDEAERFTSEVELTADKGIVVIREIQLDRTFRYRWTARGLEFLLESCREAAPCVATTFRYERR